MEATKTEEEGKGNISGIQNYSMISCIGEGTFCNVYQGVRLQDGLVVAIKKVNLNHPLLQQNDTKFKKKISVLMNREADVLRPLAHPNIIKLYDTFEEENFTVLILEFAGGGELYARIKNGGTYTENDSRIIMKQLLEGVAYLHDRDIIHRDLKPENILFVDPSRIIIADFGLSRVISPDVMSNCGTLDYTAPEVLNAGLAKQFSHYDEKVDCWSIGVILYLLICGYLPFFSEDENEHYLAEMILAGAYEFDLPYWGHVTAACKNLISAFLMNDPQQRCSCKQALSHQWFEIPCSVKIPEVPESLEPDSVND